jgi:hypothetical protein
VKGLLTILFSVVLIVSQASSINVPVGLGKQQVSTPNCCGHCGPCKTCCVENNDSDSQQPTPAVASQGASQNDLQVLTSVALLLWQQNPTESAMVPAALLVRPSVAAPLYQRNCSYLI